MDDRETTESKRIAQIARRLTGNPDSTHALRAFILEQQVILEFTVNEVLAARFASSYRTALCLAAEGLHAAPLRCTAPNARRPA